MDLFVVSVVVAAAIATGLVLLAPLYLQSAADHDLSGPQKVHTKPVPRIGGFAVVGGALLGGAWMQVTHGADAARFWLLMACAVPAVAFGFWEDLTKAVSPSQRMLATLASAGLAIALLHAQITRTGIIGLDQFIHLPLVALALTLLIVAGVVNAINIIDGFNGLASFCVVLMLAAMAWVAHGVGDTFVFHASLVLLGATVGFFLLNYPAGLIFLGDGGAYFLGFVVAVLGILLVNGNTQVSPLFPVVLAVYPLFETMFSIYRRKLVRGRDSTDPDGIHLHTLIYRRVVRQVLMDDHPVARRKVARNAMTSPALWLLCLSTVVPAVWFWNRTMVLGAVLLGFMLLYVGLYWAIVRFKVPRWLVLRRRSGFRAVHPLRGSGRAEPATDPMKRPRVTLITVSHNQSSELSHTLSSVARQTYPDIEHIVIDRGSTDATPRALFRERTGNTRVVNAGAELGLAEALNKGIALATGDIIGFLDAGCMLTRPNSVEFIVRAAQANRSGIVYCDMAFYRFRGSKRLRVRSWQAGIYHPSSLRYGWRPPRMAMYVKRSLLSCVGGFDSVMRMAMDHDHALRTFAIEGREPAYVPEVLVAGPERPPLSQVIASAPARLGDELRALQACGVGGWRVVALLVARRSLRGLRAALRGSGIAASVGVREAPATRK